MELARGLDFNQSLLDNVVMVGVPPHDTYAQCYGRVGRGRKCSGNVFSICDKEDAERLHWMSGCHYSIQPIEITPVQLWNGQRLGKTKS